MRLVIKGFYTALVSPFDKNGHFDADQFRLLIRFQIDAGTDGLVVLGTTGEEPTLSTEDKEAAMRIAREETMGKIPLIVGTGSYSTSHTIEKTCKAKEFGADGAMIVTPYYNRPTQEGIYRHFKAISEAVSIPLLVYNHQGRTGQNIQTETLLRIAELPTVCGVKDASSSLTQMMEILDKIKRHRPDFSVLSGDDLQTFPLMTLGGDGVISVIGNLVPLHLKWMVEALQSNDLHAARRLHFDLLKFCDASNIETNPISIKCAMQLSGIAVGGCRLPLCEMRAENHAKLQATLADPDVHRMIAENISLVEVGKPVTT